MKYLSEKSGESDVMEKPVLVWDLPTRLFHWLTVVLVAACFVTGKIGGNLMDAHMIGGTAVLTLLIFRLIWGFFGGKHARFAAFVCGPATVMKYAAGLLRKDTLRHLGHNPLGGWSVLAMLGALSLQAVTGLFTHDDIFTQGPLYPLVGRSVSGLLGRIHRANEGLVVFLVTVHILAVLFYLVAKRDNLILPMITGFKRWRGCAPSAGGNLWVAAVIAGLSFAVVYFMVNLN